MAFRWNEKKLQAAKLVAENNLSRERIAEEVGCGFSTLVKWKMDPDFKAKVAEYEAEIEAEMMRLPIAKRHVRVNRLNDLARRLQVVIDDRESAYAEDEDIIGGRSGAVVKQIKSVGYGKDSRIVEEYAVDTALIRELRAIDEQAAKELGQWIDKGELTGKNGQPLTLTEIVVDLSLGVESPDDDEDDPEEDD